MNDSIKPWYANLTCGECVLFDGEECNGSLHEGKARYDGSVACEEFDDGGEEE